MVIDIISPSSELLPYIKYYWVIEADIDDSPVTERIVPTPHVELLFHYRKPFVNQLENNNHVLQPRSVISGPSKSWMDVSTQGEAGVIAVSFHPGAASVFFRFPVSELHGVSYQLEDVIGREAVYLEEQINLAPDNDSRIRIIEQFLLSQYHPADDYNAKLISEAIKKIELSAGQITASELCNSLCVTPRTLERKFAALAGTPPKRMIQLVRFQHILQNLPKLTHYSLTQLSYSCGYFDQAHFIRDFKKYSGYTPGEMLRRICKS